VPINSCDFTEASYSFDDVADDFDLTHFDKAVTQDTKTIIPMIQAAKAASSVNTADTARDNSHRPVTADIETISLLCCDSPVPMRSGCSSAHSNSHCKR
jgi:hypothetical protein